MKIEFEDGTYVEIVKNHEGMVHILVATQETPEKFSVNSATISMDQMKTLISDIREELS